jgi:hypothetical protein
LKEKTAIQWWPKLIANPLIKSVPQLSSDLNHRYEGKTITVKSLMVIKRLIIPWVQRPTLPIPLPVGIVIRVKTKTAY